MKTLGLVFVLCGLAALVGTPFFAPPFVSLPDLMLGLAGGVFGLVVGLAGGLFGLVVGLIAGLFGAAVGIAGAMFGIGVALFTLAIPILIVVALVIGIMKLVALA
jgi:hypothetical protein